VGWNGATVPVHRLDEGLFELLVVPDGEVTGDTSIDALRVIVALSCVPAEWRVHSGWHKSVENV